MANKAIAALLSNQEVAQAIAAGMEFPTVVKLEEGESITGDYLGKRADTLEDSQSGEVKDVSYLRLRVQTGVIAEILGSAQLERLSESLKEGERIMLMRGPQTKSRKGNVVNTFFIGRPSGATPISSAVNATEKKPAKK